MINSKGCHKLIGGSKFAYWLDSGKTTCILIRKIWYCKKCMDSI